MDAILAGACGYLLKDASIQELMQGLRGGSRRRVADLAAHRREGAPARARHDQRAREAAATISAELSDREIQVLKLIANGKDNAVIAGELHISPKTVKNHISNILMKLQIENRIQAAVYGSAAADRPALQVGRGRGAEPMARLRPQRREQRGRPPAPGRRGRGGRRARRPRRSSAVVPSARAPAGCARAATRSRSRPSA